MPETAPSSWKIDTQVGDLPPAPGRALSDEEEMEVSTQEIETPTPDEEKRFEEDERALKQMQGLVDRVKGFVIRRGNERGSVTMAEKEAKRLETLMDGYVRFRSAVGEPGVNFTEKVSLVRDLPDGSDHQVYGYAKLQRGERTIGVDPAQGMTYLLKPTILASGRLQLEREPFVALPSDTPKEVERKLGEHRYAIHRYKQGSAITGRAAWTYGVPAEKIPFGRLEFGYRYTDLGHPAKAEAAAFMLATAVGSEVIPPTVLRKDGAEVVSVQLESAGASLYKSKEASAILFEGPDHVAADSFMELVVMDYLLMSSDRHADNLLYDEKAKKFVGIDNGYSLGYSETLPSGNVPIDPYLSVPMEVVSLYAQWQIGDALRQRLQSAFEAVSTYLALREGKLSVEEVASLPESVKEGDVAKLISQSFRLLHERVGEDRKAVPETTVIAKKEAHLFLERLKRVLAEGRPPAISGDAFKLQGFRQHVNEVLVKQEKQPLMDLPPDLPAAFMPPPPLPKVNQPAPRA